MIRRLRISERLRLVCDAVEARERLRFWLPVAAVAGLALPFYWLSAVPHVNGGDTGEFQTFGYLGGIAHPPTYPLLTGLIFAGSHALGFLEPAHAANVVNATIAALATALLFIVARDVTGSWAAAATATVVYATGFRVWADAAQAEAFSLQAALVLGVAVALRAFQRRPTPARLAGVAFATGLSLTNHGLSVFMVPLTLAYVLFRWPLRVPRPREAVMSAGAFALGLTPWIYLLRARWTAVVLKQPETRVLLEFRDMWDLVVTASAAPGGVGLVERFVNDPGPPEARWHALTTDTLREFGWLWIIAITAGFFFIAARDWRLAVWTLGTAAFTAWFAFLYEISDYDQYFSLIYVVLSIWLAGGLALLLTAVRTALPRFGFGRLVRPAMCALSIVILAGAGARAGVQMTGDAGRNISEQWEHAETHYVHARSQIRHMVPDSVYMTNWPSSLYHQYALHIEGFGSDKNIEVRTTRYETMGIDQAEEILRSNRSLYLQRSTPAYERDFTVVPEGAFFQVFRSVDIHDGELVKGDRDRVYLIEGGQRRWIPTLEIFDAHGFAWGRVRVLEDRDVSRLPEGPPLEMPKTPKAGPSKPPCPPTCVPAS